MSYRSKVSGLLSLPRTVPASYRTICQPDLSGVRFGAVGIGNHEYDLFCGAIKLLEQQLIQLGAKRIGERLEIDVLEHEIPEDPAEAWVADWHPLI